MNSMGVRAALAFLLLFIATVKAGEGGVTFWQENFTMTCPEVGTWYKKTEEIQKDSKECTLIYDGKAKGLYHCKYDDDDDDNSVDIIYYFYVKGSVCANCYEVDATWFALFMVADVVGTVCVMVIVYRCTKKKSSAGPTHASKAPARSGGQPPLLYEPLNHHTRSQDPYSVVNRTG